VLDAIEDFTEGVGGGHGLATYEFISGTWPYGERPTWV
jgi:hypothetical protein